ncbi:MAG: acetyl-CoA carboxylase, carboxyltransferase subunit beta [Candidatus Xenobia bacterium]
MAGLFEKLREQRPKYTPPKNGKKEATRDIPDDLWVKCASCSTPVFRKEFEENLKVCQRCEHHHKLNAWERLALLADPGSFEQWDENISGCDPLNFSPDYLPKLRKDQEKTRLKDAILSGQARIHDVPIALGIMDFSFRGGSMGSVVGEKVARTLERGAELKRPVVMVTSSGGARMQEGVLSLMQMAKTCAAVNRVREAPVPYIVVLTDPTTAGVAASFASLGDVIIAEPKAIIGFSGARVIEQTIRQKLPAGFQTSEFYLKAGFIDSVVPRKELRDRLGQILKYFV